MITEFLLIVFYCFLVFLSIIGLAYLIMKLICDFLTAKSETTEVTAIFLKGNDSDIELKLLLEKHKWSGQTKKGNTVFVVNCGVPKDIKLECKRTVKQYDFAVYIEKDSYIELIKGL